MSHPDPKLASHDWLARAYDAVLSTADMLHRRRHLTAAIALPLMTLAAVAINHWVLLDFPNSGDEYNYVYQADTFAAGRLWNAPLPPAEVFTTNYIVQDGTRTFSSFPFGWPLVLALAQRAGIPLFLVNPILGAATIALVWRLGARLYSGPVGVIAAALVALSPFVLFNAASYFSHTFCGAVLLAAAVVASRDDRRTAWVPLLVGVLVGWAVVARYLTGVVCAVPIVLWLLRPGVSVVRTAALLALGGLPWILALAFYNQAMTGDPLELTTTPLTVSLWFRDGWLLRSADILSTHLLRHLSWTPPIVVFGYVFYLRAAPPALRRGALDWMFVLLVAVLYFYVERGGNQYGPRFHYEVFLFAAVFVTANVFRRPTLAAAPVADRRAFALFAASVAVLPVSMAVHAVIERRVVVERTDPYRQVAALGLTNAVVLITDRVGTVRSMGAPDLTRNGINPPGAVLFGLDQADDRPCHWTRMLPGRMPYLYAWDHAAARGQLIPLDCQTAR